MLLALLLAGCDNSCIHLCQQYERFLDACGYGWATQFREEGWTSIDDCYDTHWEADEQAQQECSDEFPDWDDKGCEEVGDYR